MGNPPFPEKNSLIFFERKRWPAQHLQACQLVVSLLQESLQELCVRQGRHKEHHCVQVRAPEQASNIKHEHEYLITFAGISVTQDGLANHLTARWHDETVSAVPYAG